MDGPFMSKKPLGDCSNVRIMVPGCRGCLGCFVVVQVGQQITQKGEFEAHGPYSAESHSNSAQNRGIIRGIATSVKTREARGRDFPVRTRKEERAMTREHVTTLARFVWRTIRSIHSGDNVNGRQTIVIWCVFTQNLNLQVDTESGIRSLVCLILTSEQL